ncbi:MAG: TetR/AcrR family transcriptional regulator [Cytophagia bacterium]|nr:MAG: TetR/AcrR family transcriptional regulator [Cytophagia bacterium]
MAIEERKLKEKLQRYNAILDAAEKIMKASGVYNLNMDLVAKETELAKGTLYLYFKSKEEILAALSIKSRNLLLTHFEKSTLNIDNPIEQLKAIAFASFNFFKKYPFYFELIAIYEVNNKLEETAEIQKSINKLINFVNGITIKAKEKGLLNIDLDPIQYTFCLWGMLIGMSQLVKVRGAVMEDYLGFTEKDIINTFMIQLEMGMKK